jgi:hypothetical protein
MIDIYILTACLTISWFITAQENIQEMFDKLFTYVLPKNFITNVIYTILGCWTCLAFWVTFAVTLDFIDATIVSLIAFSWQTLLEKK